jgi:hypothetical protein
MMSTQEALLADDFHLLMDLMSVLDVVSDVVL